MVPNNPCLLIFMSVQFPPLDCELYSGFFSLTSWVLYYTEEPGYLQLDIFIFHESGEDRRLEPRKDVVLVG